MDILRDRVITSCWTRADALKVHFDDPTTTQPKVNIDFPVMSEKLFIWDIIPLRDLEGNIVSVNGWSIIFYSHGSETTRPI
ncbi:MAG: glycoside hydrolase family 68 protein [Candidatus Arsenophonus phytopathogenicus]